MWVKEFPGVEGHFWVMPDPELERPTHPPFIVNVQKIDGEFFAMEPGSGEFQRVQRERHWLWSGPLVPPEIETVSTKALAALRKYDGSCLPGKAHEFFKDSTLVGLVGGDWSTYKCRHCGYDPGNECYFPLQNL